MAPKKLTFIITIRLAASAHRSRMAKTTTKTAAKKAGGKSSKKSKKTQAKGKTTVLKSAKIKSNK
ncbi:hypothetical protein TYRP_019979 [Tyrophagus putrescentiae]|nr:hypothetical protein TYRP_019979 [Tyrophagus putrescentiae]